jgi:hypothetical protein
MNNEDAHAHRICRLFVLCILGIVVITFLLVVWFFHVPVGKNRAISNTAPAQRQAGLPSASLLSEFHQMPISEAPYGIGTPQREHFAETALRRDWNAVLVVSHLQYLRHIHSPHQWQHPRHNVIDLCNGRV